MPLCPECAAAAWQSIHEPAVPVPASWISILEPSPAAKSHRVAGIAAAAVLLLAVGIGTAVLAARRKLPPPPPAAAVEPPPAAVAEMPREEPPPLPTLDPAPALEGLLADLDRETAEPESREQFKLVLELLGRARARRGEPAWTAAVDERVEVLKAKAAAHFAVVRALAADAPPAERDRVRERVARWGIDEYLAQFDREFARPAPAEPAGIPVAAAPAKPAFEMPKEPPRSPEAKAYLAEWERAVARGALREYDAVMGDLRRAAREFQEAGVRREAAADVDDVRSVALLVEEIGTAMAKWPRGGEISLEFREAAGVRRVSGAVLRADRDRVELRAAGSSSTVFVEYADATAPSLAALYRARAGKRPEDDRALALLCLLEGELEAAAALLGGKTDAVPAKYWIRAPEARARAPKPDPAALRAQASARELYTAAEREFRSPGTRGPAVERYRTLLKDYPETALVRRAVSRITLRSEAGREYFFLAAEDGRAGGTFRLRKGPPAGAFWTSAGDSEIRKTHENFVEFEFSAMADLAYRCWVQAGACCGESFTSYAQASELARPHPDKPKTTLFLEPGSRNAITLAAPQVLMKPDHAAHAAGKPKEPALWGWVEVPLPKFATPGLKRVRILTAQAGFSVARALVSSVRKGPPPDSELKDLEADRSRTD